MEPNDMQIGGNHYRGNYQHWDMAIDTNMPYLLGCATKYPTRWKDKNGTEDLRKSIHYLSKAEERGISMPKHDERHVDLFCRQLPSYEGKIVKAICDNKFEEAIRMMENLINDSDFGPGPEYIKG